ncbi:hypothetical protein [Fimbriimonas ginsengisoli]|uniref:5-bromo-4-chloroindolyl phosphate hydrolysis protein n=1 Tax=Fimbriimonas ginsengisoli Gsoil 348 TaxID=661478 RepID=A0A068NRU4_FIMGI|nr:hypothetical protein [Fimbriimonas ginsengisoli]AIE85485.1 hypothetical protein OP10G_2117 [Fimbriimonas ginsengisoli Gsoil 348]
MRIVPGVVASAVFLFLFFVALSPLGFLPGLALSLVLSAAAFAGTQIAMAGRTPSDELREQDESTTLLKLSAMLPKLQPAPRENLSALIRKAGTVRSRLIEAGQSQNWQSYIRPSLNIIALATNDFAASDQSDPTIAAAYKNLLEKHSQQLDTLLTRLNLESASSTKAALEGYQLNVEELGQLYNVGGPST